MSRLRHRHKVHSGPARHMAAPFTERKHGGRVHHAHAEGHEGKERHDRSSRRAAGGGQWIAGAIKHPGALRKSLHVKSGEKIPAKKLNKAAHSSNPTLRKRAVLAKTLSKMHHG